MVAPAGASPAQSRPLRPAAPAPPEEEPHSPAADSPPPPRFRVPPGHSTPSSGGIAVLRGHPWPPAPLTALCLAEYSVNGHSRSQLVFLNERVIPTPSLLRYFKLLYITQAVRFKAVITVRRKYFFFFLNRNTYERVRGVPHSPSRFLFTAVRWLPVPSALLLGNGGARPQQPQPLRRADRPRCRGGGGGRWGVEGEGGGCRGAVFPPPARPPPPCSGGTWRSQDAGPQTPAPRERGSARSFL